MKTVVALLAGAALGVISTYFGLWVWIVRKTQRPQ